MNPQDAQHIPRPADILGAEETPSTRTITLEQEQLLRVTANYQAEIEGSKKLRNANETLTADLERLNKEFIFTGLMNKTLEDKLEQLGRKLRLSELKLADITREKMEAERTIDEERERRAQEKQRADKAIKEKKASESDLAKAIKDKKASDDALSNAKRSPRSSDLRITALTRVAEEHKKRAETAEAKLAVARTDLKTAIAKLHTKLNNEKERSASALVEAERLSHLALAEERKRSEALEEAKKRSDETLTEKTRVFDETLTDARRRANLAEAQLATKTESLEAALAELTGHKRRADDALGALAALTDEPRNAKVPSVSLGRSDIAQVKVERVYDD